MNCIKIANMYLLHIIYIEYILKLYAGKLHGIQSGVVCIEGYPIPFHGLSSFSIILLYCPIVAIKLAILVGISNFLTHPSYWLVIAARHFTNMS